MGYDRLYFLKKAYAIYPGLLRARCAPVLRAHYDRRLRGRGVVRAALDCTVALGFLAWIPWRAAAVQRAHGLSDGWRRMAIRIARERFVDPNDVALFRIERPEAVGDYIRRFEDADLNRRINPLGWGRQCALADKRRFEARCRAAGLAQPETVAVVRRGSVEVCADPGGRDLVAKPANGEGGEGVRILAATVDRADLAHRLAGLGGDWIVQARVVGPADLADISLNALSTVRVVTILDETGAPEVVSATLRFASRIEAVVDNMKAGGLIAAVDLQSGALGPAWFGYGGDAHLCHPLTGGAVAGRQVPQWPQVAALARRAHAAAFRDYALVGWDIAPSSQGPVLIEGNAKPGVLMPQRAAGRGLAQGRYGALLAHHLSVAG